MEGLTVDPLWEEVKIRRRSLTATTALRLMLCCSVGLLGAR